jgi:hypothetical protein
VETSREDEKERAQEESSRFSSQEKYISSLLTGHFPEFMNCYVVDSDNE